MEVKRNADSFASCENKGKGVVVFPFSVRSPFCACGAPYLARARVITGDSRVTVMSRKETNGKGFKRCGAILQDFKIGDFTITITITEGYEQLAWGVV